MAASIQLEIFFCVRSITKILLQWVADYICILLSVAATMQLCSSCMIASDVTVTHFRDILYALFVTSGLVQWGLFPEGVSIQFDGFSCMVTVTFFK